MNLFHLHKFDPEKWKLVQQAEVSMRWTKDIHTIKFLYSNTCTKCGDLVFKTSQIGVS